MKEKRDIKLYILDMLQAIDEVNEFVKDIPNAEAFGVPLKVRINHPEVEWRDVMSMRNKLVHEYFGVDNKVVWDAIKKNFPELKEIIIKIKNSLL